MNKILTILRDPIWQFIGASLAVISILIPLLQPDNTTGKLVIAPYSKYGLVSFFTASEDPDSNLLVLVGGKQFPSKQLIVNTYYIWNKSKNAITPEDYFEKITITPEEGFEILEVKKVTEKKAKNDLWKKGANGEFVLKDILLNPKDVIYFQIFMRVIDDKLIKNYRDLDDTKFIEFSGKIKNIDLKTYSTSKEVFDGESDLETYTDLGLDGIQTVLDGRGIISLFTVGAFLIFSQTLLMQAANLIPKISYKVSLQIILMFILSIITAEITVDSLINKTDQHPIIYPLLLCHGLFIAFLIKNAISNKN